MKKAATFLSLAALVFIVTAAGPKDDAKSDAIAEMAWIAGTWEGPMWGGTFSAYYCTPEGGKVMSYNTLTRDGKVSFYEFEVFELDKEGKVIFRPFPGGKASAKPLWLAESDEKNRKVTFENKKKDYPTRIVYHRVEDDRLVITLSDPFGDSDKTETFDLKRKK